jgi:putative DNA primase/helicase
VKNEIRGPAASRKRRNANASATEDGHDDRPLAFSDVALARRFANEHGDKLRYVASWGKWLLWTGKFWRPEDTMAAFDNAREICYRAALGCDRANKAAAIASKQTIAAVESLAKADRRLVATVDQWDADQSVINTPDGVVDLRTGQMRAARPADYMTKITAVGPHGNCPRFLEFLNQITRGDADLIAFFRRVLGYCLTGETREQALFFAYGTGANGKSVLFSTVAGLLASYHRTAHVETFTAMKGDRHPTDLAGLRGARLVTATETEEGRHWAESRIKQLTGGDLVSARFMRQDFFEYRPAFKLMIAGNHKPSLRSVDEAMRRRFHMIPFAVTIPSLDRDPELTEKLKAEWPGILKWMIDGCLEWQREGLNPPKVVRDATAAYFEVEDVVGAWIKDTCEPDPRAWESSSTLFSSWRAWAEANGEPPLTTKGFAQKLESAGFRPLRMRKGRGFQGIRVVPVEPI